MRRVHRVPLSEATETKLCDLTHQVAAAGLAAGSTIGKRTRGRREAARTFWDNRTRNTAFDEIRKKLKAMAPGTERCMYCEVSLGNVIEHFWPKEKYPGRAFSWQNYLWSCSICNSDHKGTKFPRDANGAPLLLNPADEDPAPHMEFSPSTGKLTGVTPKGIATVEVLGFEKRGGLDRARKCTWDSIESLIVWYAVHRANGDAEKVERTQRTIREQPFAAALVTLLTFAADPARRGAIHPACLEAIERHPEIRTWL